MNAQLYAGSRTAVSAERFFLLLDQPAGVRLPAGPDRDHRRPAADVKNAGLAALGLITAAAAASSGGVNEPQRSGSTPTTPSTARNSAVGGAEAADVDVAEDQMVPMPTFALLRPSGGQGCAVESRHRHLPVRRRRCRCSPRLPGRRSVGSPILRRTARIAAAAAISVSLLALVKDLGRPSASSTCSGCSNRPRRCRWAPPGTSPHTLRGAYLAGAAEVAKLLPGGLGALGRLLGWTARSVGGWPRRSSLRPSRRTPRCCSPTPPLRPGTTPTGAAGRVRWIRRGRLRWAQPAAGADG